MRSSVTALAQGTKVRPRFSVSESQRILITENDVLAVHLPSLRVLIIDDDPLILESLRNTLHGVPAVLTVLALVIALRAVLLYGRLRWVSRTRELRGRLEATRASITPRSFRQGEIEALPAPVQRYFRAVLPEGQPIIAAVNLEQVGTMNLDDTGEHWSSFTAKQRIVTCRPGFDWGARISVARFAPIYVHEAYIAGEGLLHAALVGLMPVADLHGTGEIARSELMRFLAEAAWYPTALLPGQGVRWDAVDGRSARVTLNDDKVSAMLLVGFNEEGLIGTVRAEARGRTVDGKIVPTPWEGRYWNYVVRDGMRVPTDAEVAWGLPEGVKPYWRGHVANMTYEFAK